MSFYHAMECTLPFILNTEWPLRDNWFTNQFWLYSRNLQFTFNSQNRFIIISSAKILLEFVTKSFLDPKHFNYFCNLTFKWGISFFWYQIDSEPKCIYLLEAKHFAKPSKYRHLEKYLQYLFFIWMCWKIVFGIRN